MRLVPARPSALAVAVALGFALLAVEAAVAGKGRPAKAKEDLTAPEGGPLPDARGQIRVKHFPEVGNRPERSWVRLKAKKLAKKADYSVWVDDPATPEEDYAQWESFTTKGNGNLNLRADTKKGGEMPHDATLTDLQGAGVQVRDAEDAVVLEGLFPTFPAAEEEPPAE